MPVDSTPARPTLVAPSLSGGGAERTAARLASYWAEQGRAVTLLTLDEPTPGDWPLHAGVTRVGLGVTGESANLVAALAANRRRVRALRAAIGEARPDAVVSLVDQTNVLTLLAMRRSGVPVVVAERTDPRFHPLGFAWRFLRDQTYLDAAAVVVQTEDLADWARSRGWNANVVRIPNGVDARAGGGGRRAEGRDQGSGGRSQPPAGLPPPSHTPRTLLALGRLAPEKGFDLLVAAFATVAAGYPDWRLVIGGEGPSRGELERLVAASHLSDRVFLPGRLDPAAALADADLFALTSLYEGFPNALLEAMAAGVCPVCLLTSAAVAEIVRDGEDGVLVLPADDPRATAEEFGVALSDLMRRPTVRRRLGDAARSVTGRYSMTRFFERWDAVLASAVGQAPA